MSSPDIDTSPATGTTALSPAARRKLGGRWIDDWRPEDPDFWASKGKAVAKRNLIFSVTSEHIGFSVWSLWSVLVLFLGPSYGFDPAQKFLLTALPTLTVHQYRIKATNLDSGGFVYLDTPFGVVNSNGDPGTVTPTPGTGWATWPTWVTNTEGFLGVHTPGGNDQWDYTLELDTSGHTVDTARVQMDNLGMIQLFFRP